MFAYCNNNPVANEDPAGHSLRPSTTVMNDGGTGYYQIDGDTDARNNALLAYACGNVIPLSSKYMHAAIEYKGLCIFDNNKLFRTLTDVAITAVSTYISFQTGGVYTVIGRALSVIGAGRLLATIHSKKPETGYYPTWELDVRVFVDVGDERRVENRKYTYLLVPTSSTEYYYYQASLKVVYEYVYHPEIALE